MATASESIPLVDLEAPAQDIVEGISQLGFLYLKCPAIPAASSVERMFDLSRQFFLSESITEKEKVAITINNAGWVKLRQEALDSDGYPSGDIKEAFNMRQFDKDDVPRQPLPPILQSNVQEIAQFMRDCHQLCLRILETFAIALNLPKDFFTERHPYGSPQGSVLRLLYYPETDVSGTKHRQDIRAGAHSDYGSLTLLFQQTHGGLQVLLPSLPGQPSDEARWLDAPVIKDAVLVNIGDLMDFWTAGKFKSTLHRVKMPQTSEEAKPRFSIAYFLHPDDEVRLARIIPSDVKEEEDTSFKRSAKSRFGVDPNEAPLTAKEWLERRLTATYTGRKDS
ncbi:hypothetical protein FRC03_003671 [Tulasnella sp. 419]|nr:hypothetical protein FRC03_003671 [Tulasnella sp. 419]